MNQKTKKIWSFIASQEYDFKQELFDNYKLKGRFFDDVIAFFDQMGLYPHPSLKAPQGKEYTEPNIINFLNILIDINTFKILFFLLPTSRIIDLKFCSNMFDYTTLEYLIQEILNKPSNIFSFVFEWNSKIKYHSQVIDFAEQNSETDQISKQVKSLIVKLATSSKLEALCLRGNFLGNDATTQLFSYMKVNANIKILNLYKNNLSSEVIPSLLQVIEFNKKLEEINLGANLFIDEDLLGMKDLLGKIAISNEEAENIQKKARDKEIIIEKNKKLKNQKKPEEPIPIVEEIQQIGDTWFIIRNNRIRNLNLMLNSFTKNCYDTIVHFLEVSDELFITIDGKIFSYKQRETLIDPRQKYSSRIYLTK